MTVLDENFIATKVTKRFGISFEGLKDEYDGEIFSVIRPKDLPKPNGFAIAISKTTRIIEASLKLDNFSGGMLRSMGDVDASKIELFEQALKSIKSLFNVDWFVNGIQTNKVTESFNGDTWKSFEFDCDIKLSHKEKTDQVELNSVSCEIVFSLLNAILILLEVQEIGATGTLFEEGLPEGAKIRVEVNKYERSPINRAACIACHGATCKICEFDFGRTYGKFGDEYIEVHHLIPVSKMGGHYQVNPETDLVPVCSNCHSMIHRREPPLSIDEVRKLIIDPRQKIPGEVKNLRIADASFE
jgi:5-methylcytosine-specific restriction protein A